MKKKEMTERLFELEARVAQLEARLYWQPAPGRLWFDVHPDPWEMTVTWTDRNTEALDAKS